VSIEAVTRRIINRSAATRANYLARMADARFQGKAREGVSCSNLAHALAGMPGKDKELLLTDARPNLGIITSYNDMLSAHQPYELYPPLLRRLAAECGGAAQVAGSVPAMCDGVTQGQPGMELSLFSRDLIAMAGAIGLSHNVYDGVIFLGVCDKIVPGLLITAATFGHLPAIFIPSGPMPSSAISNQEKAHVRQAYASGKAGRDQLLTSEMQSYHSPGTCTFYGTANTNQMLLELMGLMLPGASFANPDSDLRARLTRAAVNRAIANARDRLRTADMISEKSLVNAMVGLLASGGSTNSAMHLIVIAAAAGIQIKWEDYAELSTHVPLLARVYPNGKADVNQFDAAGGIGALVGELLSAGLLHEEVPTVAGSGMKTYADRLEPDGATGLRRTRATISDNDILRSVASPFARRGGLEVLHGNLGQAIMKTSAVAPEHQRIKAPAMVFDSQEAFIAAYKKGECNRDLVAVVRFQGPSANGMPELHKLMPILGVLQDKGYSVALVTDGRLSGASGKVAAAIHLTPEAAKGGLLVKLRDGDQILLDGVEGRLEASNVKQIQARKPAIAPHRRDSGCGRELFAQFRAQVSHAGLGASQFGDFGLGA